MKRTHSYGQNICWMLCCAVTSYRLVKMGVVGKGDVVVQKSGKIMSKVSDILGMGGDLPFVGSVCSVISKVASVYVGMEEGLTVEKIVVCTKHFLTEQQLAKAVTSAVLMLLKDKEHVNMLEKEEEQVWYGKLLEKAGEKKDELVSKISGISLVSNDDKQAIVDCSFILSQMLRAEELSENPFADAAKELLKEKKEEEEKREEKRVKKEEAKKEKEIQRAQFEIERKKQKSSTEGSTCKMCKIM